MSGAHRTDRAGAIAGTVCAAHCAVSAFLPAAFGVLGLGFLLGHEAEWALSLLSIAFAVIALGLAWRQRRDRRVVLLLAIGILGLLASRFVEEAGGHGDEHGEAGHHEESHHEEGHHEEGHHEEGHEASHLLGTAIGVMAGLTLVGGHLLNLRAQRCKPSCDDDC